MSLHFTFFITRIEATSSFDCDTRLCMTNYVDQAHLDSTRAIQLDKPLCVKLIGHSCHRVSEFHSNSRALIKQITVNLKRRLLSLAPQNTKNCIVNTVVKFKSNYLSISAKSQQQRETRKPHSDY